MLLQWRSSAPKSGGGGHKLFAKKVKSKKKKKKVTAAFKRMIGYSELGEGVYNLMHLLLNYHVLGYVQSVFKLY